MDEDICPKCGTVFEDIVESCPSCGAQIIYCEDPSCGAALAASMESCPYCGERVTSATPLPSSVPETLEQLPSPDSSPDSGGGGGSSGRPSTIPPEALGAIDDNIPASQTPLPGVNDPSLQVDMPDVNAMVAEPVDALGRGGLPAMDDMSMVPGVPSSPAMNLGAGIPASPLGSSSVPFLMEVDAGQSFKQQEQGLIRLRIRPSALPSQAAITITAKASSGLGITTPMPIHLKGLNPLEIRQIPSLRCTPAVAGADELEVSVTATNEKGYPLGRWAGSWPFRVAGREEGKVVHIEARDIIDLGGGPQGAQSGWGLDAQGAARPAERWEPIVFQPDRDFMDRLGRSAPGRLLDIPDVKVDLPAGAAMDGLRLRLAKGEQAKEETFLFWGKAATVGRRLSDQEPGPGALLQVAPDDDAPTDCRRVSGTHIRVALRDRRAWMCDVSTNGTWLNGERVTRDDWQLLAEGDEVSFRSRTSASQARPIVRFTVHLQADKEGVYALYLCQLRTVGGPRTYALASRAAFWPKDGRHAFDAGVTGQTGLWFVAKQDEQGKALAWMDLQENTPRLLSPADGSFEARGWKISLPAAAG